MNLAVSARSKIVKTGNTILYNLFEKIDQGQEETISFTAGDFSLIPDDIDILADCGVALETQVGILMSEIYWPGLGLKPTRSGRFQVGKL